MPHARRQLERAPVPPRRGFIDLGVVLTLLLLFATTMLLVEATHAHFLARRQHDARRVLRTVDVSELAALRAGLSADDGRGFRRLRRVDRP